MISVVNKFLNFALYNSYACSTHMQRDIALSMIFLL